MFSKKILLSTLIVSAPFLLAGCDSAQSAAVGNHISGEGLPNPAPIVTQNWGDLPAGREWGSTAGVDIDPTDGQVWAYERCGASAFGGGAPINCDTNPVDPIFKFDRNTLLILFSAGQTPFSIKHTTFITKSKLLDSYLNRSLTYYILYIIFFHFVDNFIFSANPGFPLAPLSEIASGGEKSRVLLAIKVIFSS